MGPGNYLFYGILHSLGLGHIGQITLENGNWLRFINKTVTKTGICALVHKGFSQNLGRGNENNPPPSAP